MISRNEAIVPNDEAAMAAARQYLDDNGDVAVWDHTGKVGTLSKTIVFRETLSVVEGIACRGQQNPFASGRAGLKNVMGSSGRAQ